MYSTTPSNTTNIEYHHRHIQYYRHHHVNSPRPQTDLPACHHIVSSSSPWNLKFFVPDAQTINCSGQKKQAAEVWRAHDGKAAGPSCNAATTPTPAAELQSPAPPLYAGHHTRSLIPSYIWVRDKKAKIHEKKRERDRQKPTERVCGATHLPAVQLLLLLPRLYPSRS